MSIVSILKFITKHPLNRKKPFASVLRFLHWQIRSRLEKDVTFNWIDGSKLIVQRGMAGATGNIYCGLHEYEDMSFLIHLLRPGDLFVDVGANIGSYTILASKVCRADTIAVEPDPLAGAFLLRNVRANEIEHSVAIARTAVGAKSGTITFSVGCDTMNKVVEEAINEQTQIVEMSRLDDIVGDKTPSFMKIDVEGFEPEALKGAERTLSSPKLMALEIETVDDEVRELLTRQGFQHRSYDPVKRQLVDPRVGNSNNALFVRDFDEVERRLNSSPTRMFRGSKI